MLLFQVYILVNEMRKTCWYGQHFSLFFTCLHFFLKFVKQYALNSACRNVFSKNDLEEYPEGKSPIYHHFLA